MKRGIALAALCLASSASAQTPDYVAFSRLADEYADLVVALPYCEAHGFQVQRGRAQAAADEVVSEGVEMGINVALADRIVEDAIIRERQNIDHLWSRAREGGEPAMREFAGFIEARCVAFDSDPTWTDLLG